MYLCKVAGKVVCTIKLPSLGAGSLIIVEPVSRSGSDEKGLMVAYDSIGCGEGDVVLVTSGSSARNVHTSPNASIDLAVVGIVDSYEIFNVNESSTSGRGKQKPKTKPV